MSVDGQSFTTPAEVKLSRSKNYDVEFETEDYIPATRQVTRDTNGWTFGNIIIGGVIGLLIDYSTGAANTLTPEVVRVDLVRKPPPPDAQQGALEERQASPPSPDLPGSLSPPPRDP